MKNVTLKHLLAVALLLSFNGCVEPIANYQGCPQLDVYELPAKILIKGNYLGKTNVYSTYNFPKLLGDTDVITTSGDSNISMENGVLMPVEMLIDIVDYVTELRIGAEKFNAQILDKNSTKK